MKTTEQVMIKAYLQDDSIVIQRGDSSVIGTLKYNKTFEHATISIDGDTYEIRREKWKSKISHKDKLIFELKTNPISGNMSISPNAYTITGAKSLKWGTRLRDNDNNELLRIKHDNLWVNNHTYSIQISSDQTQDLDIAIALYAHLYGSFMKNNVVMISGIMVTTVVAAILLK